jgi:hypothetical protein
MTGMKGEHMPLSKEDAAKRLGVPEREVLEVQAADDGDHVTTTDGVSYHITDERVAYLANYPKDTLFPVHEPPPETQPAELLGEPDGAQDAVAPELSDDEDVPEGAVGQVLAWVNRDRARAARALKVEREREEPRATLVTQLERLANP